MAVHFKFNDSGEGGRCQHRDSLESRPLATVDHEALNLAKAILTGLGTAPVQPATRSVQRGRACRKKNSYPGSNIRAFLKPVEKTNHNFRRSTRSIRWCPLRCLRRPSTQRFFTRTPANTSNPKPTTPPTTASANTVVSIPLLLGGGGAASVVATDVALGDVVFDTANLVTVFVVVARAVVVTRGTFAVVGGKSLLAGTLVVVATGGRPAVILCGGRRVTDTDEETMVCDWERERRDPTNVRESDADVVREVVAFMERVLVWLLLEPLGEAVGRLDEAERADAVCDVMGVLVSVTVAVRARPHRIKTSPRIDSFCGINNDDTKPVATIVRSKSLQ